MPTSRLPSLILTAVLGCSWVIACTSSSSTTPSATDNAGSCQLLASRCHPIQTALGKECHNLGHDGDDAKCGPRKAECLAECPEGADHDEDPVDSGGGGGDGGADADTASAVCATYCSCFLATCTSDAGASPYADEAACLAACNGSGFDAKGRTCVAAACERAKTAADKKHECEHASSPTGCH